MEARTARVMVKLAPGKAPDEVVFTDAEREAVTTAAMEAGYPHVSTFIREVCVDAALSTVRRGPDDSDWAHLKAAADSCGMPLGRWMREVVLAGIGASSGDLQEHKDAAAEFVAGALRRASRASRARG